jgi:hypothetical protein
VLVVLVLQEELAETAIQVAAVVDDLVFLKLLERPLLVMVETAFQAAAADL